MIEVGDRMKIKEVATNFNLTADTLRYYERVGLLKPISKNKSGVREYQEEDLKRIEFVKCMRGAGISIDILKEYLELFEQGDSTLMARRSLLVGEQKKLEQKIKDMEEALHKLEYKIELYDNQLLEKAGK